MRQSEVRAATILFGILWASWSPSTADDSAQLKSGMQVGERVSTFYVRAITGPLRNKSVCYVCRNGDRPVVMLFVRRMTPGLRELLKAVDTQVDEHRADGLRAFAVFFADERSDLPSAVQTLAFDEKLGMPLTISAAAVEGPAGQNLDPAAAVTVVIYRDLKVAANFAWRDADLTAEVLPRVIEAIEQLLK